MDMLTVNSEWICGNFGSPYFLIVLAHSMFRESTVGSNRLHSDTKPTNILSFILTIS